MVFWEIIFFFFFHTSLIVFTESLYETWSDVVKLFHSRKRELFNQICMLVGKKITQKTKPLLLYFNFFSKLTRNEFDDKNNVQTVYNKTKSQNSVNWLKEMAFFVPTFWFLINGLPARAENHFVVASDSIKNINVDTFITLTLSLALIVQFSWRHRILYCLLWLFR